MVLSLEQLNALLTVALVVTIVALLVEELGQGVTRTLQRHVSRVLPGPVSPRQFVPLLAGLVLAALMRTPLASAYFVVVGLAITIYVLRRARRVRRLIAPRQILQLVLSFRSLYQLQPSVFSTLDAVKDKMEEPLRSIVQHAVDTYYLTSDPHRALSKLRVRTENVYLGQLAYILEMIETARPEAVVQALDNLVERLRHHDELRRETEANLTAITGQTAFIQAIAVLVMMGVSAVPVLRAPYVPVGGQLFLIGVVTVMLVSSYFIDRVIRKLMERIS